MGPGAGERRVRCRAGGGPAPTISSSGPGSLRAGAVGAGRRGACCSLSSGACLRCPNLGVSRALGVTLRPPARPRPLLVPSPPAACSQHHPCSSHPWADTARLPRLSASRSGRWDGEEGRKRTSWRGEIATEGKNKNKNKNKREALTGRHEVHVLAERVEQESLEAGGDGDGVRADTGAALPQACPGSPAGEGAQRATGPSVGLPQVWAHPPVGCPQPHPGGSV